MPQPILCGDKEDHGHLGPARGPGCGVATSHGVCGVPGSLILALGSPESFPAKGTPVSSGSNDPCARSALRGIGTRRVHASAETHLGPGEEEGRVGTTRLGLRFPESARPSVARGSGGFHFPCGSRARLRRVFDDPEFHRVRGGTRCHVESCMSVDAINHVPLLAVFRFELKAYLEPPLGP